MRFLIVLVGMFVCLGARAATMCVPDLTACESCTAVSSGFSSAWTADCCGVKVSGVGILGFDCLAIHTDIEPEVGAFLGGEDTRFCACLMTVPYAATKIQVISNTTASSHECGRLCAENFKPSCLLHGCVSRECSELSTGGGA